MKTLNFLTTGAAAAMLLLSSCTKDVDNPQGGGNGDGGVVEGIPTYATVSLSQRSGAGTYAGAGDYVGGNSEATTEEKGIASAAVLVFNQNDILENYVKFTAPEKQDAPWAMTFPTTTGKKRLFAVANLPDASYTTLEDIFEGKNGKTAADKQLAKICKIIQTITAIGDATTANAFYMSNVYPLKDPQTQQTATTEPQVTVENITDADVNKGPADGKLNNNFTIYIGRMVAKVTPTFSANLVINSGDGTIDQANALYRVRNNPKRFYTFPVYEKNTNVLSSPYFDRTYNVKNPVDYADDNTSVGANDFFDNGAKYQPTNPGDADDDTWVNPFGPKMGEDSYLTENSPQDAARHKVTFLSIAAKWTPDKNATFLNADGTKYADPDTPGETAIANNDGTFWRVQKWEGGLIKGYLDGIYVAEPTNYIDPADGTAKNDFVTDRGDDGYLKVKYDGGIAYWAYWMKNSNNGAIAEKYALKRNNHFIVKIISVDGVGEPTEDDNLDKDDLEANTSMKATIEVLNWNVVDIEGGI